MPSKHKEIILASEDEMLSFAAKMAAIIPAGTIIYLYGPLGAGKTTWTRGFLRGLGYTDKVKSPTYTLVEPYDINGQKIYHFDLYRLHDPSELEHMGIRDHFTQQTICIIEWPEKGVPVLPAPDLACYLSFAEAGRVVRLEAHSIVGEKMLFI